MLLESIYDLLENKELDALFRGYLITEAGRNRITDSEPTTDEISRAIINRKFVGIYYEDETDEVLNGFRLIEPYVFGSGYNTSKGPIHEDRKYLRAFVIRDTSKDEAFKNKNNTIKRKSVSLSKHVPYWRLFRVDRISSWYEFPKKFSKFRELYNPDDKHINSIITSLNIDDFPRGEQQIKLTRDLRTKVNLLKKSNL